MQTREEVEKIEEICEKRKKIPKEISQEILKKIFINVLKAIGIIIYFMILNILYTKIQQDSLMRIIEIFSGLFLLGGLIQLEVAYKKDSGEIAITAIELLCLSLHTLTIMHIVTILKYDFRIYILASSYLISIYYILKSIVIYTKEKRKYLTSLSDISDIVKKDEPIKKEAKKRVHKSEEKQKNRTNNLKKEKEIKPKSAKRKQTKKKEQGKNDIIKKKQTHKAKKDKSTTKKEVKEND